MAQHLTTTPPSPTHDVVEPHSPCLEQLVKEVANLLSKEDPVDILSEDTTAQWMKEVRQNGKSFRKRLKKGATSRKRPLIRSRG